MNPGICPKEEITCNKGKMYQELIAFIGKLKQPIGDVGELNHKSQYLAEHYGAPITQIEASDFDYWICSCQKTYETILCFEVLSHLVNPGILIWNLRDLLNKDGVIYLSMPNRLRMLWNPHHWNEFGGKRFEQWILKPNRLKIVRQRRIRNFRQSVKWYRYLGVRPLIRLILNYFFNYVEIYEIRHEDFNVRLW